MSTPTPSYRQTPDEFMQKGVDLSLPAEQRVLQIKEILLDNPKGPSFEDHIRDAVFVSLSYPTPTTPLVIWRLKIPQYLCNRAGNLHGGAAATLMDNLTTTALMPLARKGFWAFAGVSRTLNCTYLRPVPLGEEVEIVCDVIHAGVRNAALRGEIRRVRDGATLVVAEHGKASVDPEVTGRL